MASTSPVRTATPGAETLADVLARDRLSLAAALRCATEVAHLLHELHQQNRTHGKVAAASVLLRPSGTELTPSRNYWDHGDPERDVRDFGALLYEMVTGSPVPSDATVGSFKSAGLPSGPAGVRAAAIRLAGKCLGHLPMKLNMQQAATEVRLLWVVARQMEAAGASESPMAPFLVQAPLPPARAIPQVPPRTIPQLPARTVREVYPPVSYPPVPVEPPPPPRPSAEAGESGAAPLVPLSPQHFSKPPAKPVELVPVNSHCPKCDGTVVYLARPRSGFERLLAQWKVPICRCHRCYHRYLVVARMRIGKEVPLDTDSRFRPKLRD